MQRPVLADERAAVDAYYLPSGESLLQDALCRAVVVGLCISGEEHSSVHDKEIGIRGRQTLSIGIRDSVWHGQRHEPVRIPFYGPECVQLLFHGMQFGVMYIGSIGTLHINDGIVRAQACQCVDVAVGIVAGQESVVEP